MLRIVFPIITIIGSIIIIVALYRIFINYFDQKIGYNSMLSLLLTILCIVVIISIIFGIFYIIRYFFSENVFNVIFGIFAFIVASVGFYIKENL